MKVLFGDRNQVFKEFNPKDYNKGRNLRKSWVWKVLMGLYEISSMAEAHARIHLHSRKCKKGIAGCQSYEYIEIRVFVYGKLLTSFLFADRSGDIMPKDWKGHFTKRLTELKKQARRDVATAKTALGEAQAKFARLSLII